MKKKSIVLIIFLFSSNIFFSKNNIDVIPFDFERGSIMINVSINEKECKFLFSSGGYSSVSNEIKEFFNLQINKSNHSIKGVSFYSIDKFKIGKTIFKNVNVKLIDINKSFGYKCSKIDGVIGADVFLGMIYRIDYDKKQIIFSDSIDDFNFSKDVKSFDFKIKDDNLFSTVSINIDNVQFDNVKVSTGFNGSINLPIEKIRKTINNYKYVEYYGAEKFSIKSGFSFFREYCTMIPVIKIQNYNLGKNSVNFSDSEVGLIGNKILKDYQVTVDWKNNILYLDNYTFHENYKIEDYGFYFYKRNDKIEVVGLYIGSNADKQGIKNGDTILKINDIDFTKISEEALCNLFFDFKNYFKNENINVTVLRDSKELNFNIAKQIILN